MCSFFKHSQDHGRLQLHIQACTFFALAREHPKTCTHVGLLTGTHRHTNDRHTDTTQQIQKFKCCGPPPLGPRHSRRETKIAKQFHTCVLRLSRVRARPHARSSVSRGCIMSTSLHMLFSGSSLQAQSCERVSFFFRLVLQERSRCRR